MVNEYYNVATKDSSELLFPDAPDEAIAILARCALRVLPYIVEVFSNNRIKDPRVLLLSVLRANILSVIASKGVVPKKWVAREALSSAEISAGVAYKAEANVAGAITIAAAEIFQETNAVGNYLGPNFGVPRSASVAYVVAVGNDLAFSDACSIDLAFLNGGRGVDDLWCRKIWPKHTDSSNIPAWAEFTSALSADPAFVFWLRWYEALWEGRPLSWELQRDVAFIDSSVWAEGADAVAETIGDIEARYLERTYRNEARRLLDTLARTETSARIGAEFLEGALTAWRNSNSAPQEELETLERVPPVLRRIAAATRAEAEAREAEMQAALADLRAEVLTLRDLVKERDAHCAALAATNQTLAAALEEAQKARSLRHRAGDALMGAMALTAAEAVFGAVVMVAPDLLGGLLDISVSDFLWERGPVEVPPDMSSETVET